MFEATITSQGQITIPAVVRRRVGFKGGDKVIFVPRHDGSGGFQMSKQTGWESLRGILFKHKGNYPTKDQLAKAHVSDLGSGRSKDVKNTGRHQRFASASY